MKIVEWCKWTDIINNSFNEVRKGIDSYRYVIFYGGRGSSKSDFTAKYIIYRCLTDKYFRAVLVRNTYATIKDSQYQTIKDIIIDLGLSELFEFKLQPLEIQCKNGNKLLARGCDDTTKLKSIKDPSFIWYEEDIPSEDDFITITTSVRTGKADILQEVFTINPEVEGDFQEHWFYKKFFNNSHSKTFDGNISTDLDGQTVEMPYFVHHSTYHDNKWLPEAFKAFLQSLKIQDPYYYTIYCLGEWGNRITGGNFYKAFNRGRNVVSMAYDPDKSLHISFDFNVNPYMTCSIWQISNNLVYNVGEIAAEYPKNTTLGICREFINMFPRHDNTVFVYGDPAGRHQDTRTERGSNDFTIIEKELEQYKPILRVGSLAAGVESRGRWINAIFSELRDVKVYISENSPLLIADLMNGKEAADGTKHKQKVKNSKTGVTYEKYHHFSDGMDYFLTEAFKSDFDNFQRGGFGYKPIISQRFKKANY